MEQIYVNDRCYISELNSCKYKLHTCKVIDIDWDNIKLQVINEDIQLTIECEDFTWGSEVIFPDLPDGKTYKLYKDREDFMVDMLISIQQSLL